MPKLMLRLAALLAPLFLMLGVQPAQAQVFVVVTGQNAQKQVIALLATGSESAKKALESAAGSKGYKSGRSKNRDGEDEVMVIVPFDADHDRYWAFHDEVKGGKYGALTLETIALPLDTDTTKDGYTDSARVWDGSLISRPALASGILGRSKGMSRPGVVLGLIGTGTEAQMARFEADGAAAGYITTRSKGDQGEPDVMVIVKRSDDAARFWQFYRQSTRGRYGNLAVEMIIVPQQYDPAAKDYLDHARIYSSSQIVEP